MICSHEWTKAKIPRSAAGQTKAFPAERCERCGTVAWTSISEKAYKAWIKELFKKEAFKAQNIILSQNSLEIIEEIKGKTLIEKDSGIIKGAVGFYFSIMINSVDMTNKAIEAFKARDQSEGKRVNVKFHPELYLKLEALSKLSDQPVKVTIESMVNLVLSDYASYSDVLEIYMPTAS